jgi:hypothetical protein
MDEFLVLISKPKEFTTWKSFAVVAAALASAYGW